MRERVGFAVAITALCALGGGGCAAAPQTKEQLRSAVDAKRAELNACYARALQRDAALRGRMQLWVHVDRKSGRVEKVEVGDHSGVENEQLVRCVGNALKAIRLESKPPANLEVEYTLDLAPATGGDVPVGRQPDGESRDPETAAGAGSEPASS